MKESESPKAAGNINGSGEQEMKENIYLIGFMGSGKSSALKTLKKLSHLSGIEMDAQIEKEEGMSISEIFRVKGEAYFRNLETALLKRVAAEGPCIVSCGGGTAMRQENVEIMKGSGKVVYLTASPETILKRVQGSNARPLLEGHKNVEYIAELLERRAPFYEAAADIVVATDDRDVKDIAGEILTFLAAPAEMRE